MILVYGNVVYYTWKYGCTGVVFVHTQGRGRAAVVADLGAIKNVGSTVDTNIKKYDHQGSLGISVVP